MNLKNKNIRKVFAVTAAMFFMMTSAGVTLKAAVPQLLTFNGILKDSGGDFLDGTYEMTFRVYSAATGGSALWSETQTDLAVDSGSFSAQLGSVTALTLPFNAPYWVSVEVESDGEMTPRVQLTSSGYAYTAEEVTNGFTEAEHGDMSHKDILGVKSNTTLVARTNFKLDAYSTAAASSMGDLIIDTFMDDSGIDDGVSTDYTWRDDSDFDVVLASESNGIDVNTTLALHANGSDTSTTFTDSSSSSHTVTANGDAQIDTAQSKFGGASALFDGSGDYLSVPSSSDWAFGTGDFTVDFWVRFNSTSGAQHLFNIGNYTNFDIVKNDTGLFEVNINSTTPISTSWNPSAGTWYHIAVVRSGNNLYAFVNGSQLGSTADVSGKTVSQDGLRVGARGNDANYTLNGWIDELRVSKGIARWTGSFTPPSAEYIAASGTGTAVVISTAFSESAAPAEAMIIADETLNTGSIDYYVSRDNGTTWTQANLEEVTDISGQPSGTQVRWKAVIEDDAELDAIAVAL